MSITQLTPDVAARYKLVEAALIAIETQARRQQVSRFTVINRKTLQTARQHQHAIQDSEGDALLVALTAAEKWLKSVA